MFQTMEARNAISAKMAECYVVIEGNRYNFMSAINLEAKMDKSKQEIPILGRANKGNKSTSGKITGSATFHYNTSVWREIAYKFQQTGEDLYFDIEIVNDDPTAKDVGRQTIILYDCNFDSVTLAKFDADSDDVLEEEMDFTAERFEMKDKFAVMPGMEM